MLSKLPVGPPPPLFPLLLLPLVFPSLLEVNWPHVAYHAPFTLKLRQLVVVLNITNPVAGLAIASLSVCVILGGRNPCVVEDTSKALTSNFQAVLSFSAIEPQSGCSILPANDQGIAQSL